MKGQWSENTLGLLQELTGGRFILSSGPVPVNSPCTVLVAGPVSEGELLNCPSLEALIVPYAGVPPSTALLMKSRPDITVKSIHHNAVSAAEMAITLMLAAAKLILPADRALRRGDWTPRYRPEGLLIEDSSVLVLGWGSIGKRVGRTCSSMGAEVNGIRRTPQKGFHTPDELHSLLPETDILVVSLPLNESTRGIIGEEELALMPKGGVLVNIARGPVVNEKALYQSLKNGHLGAAGIDVWYTYPSGEETRNSTQPSACDFGSLPNVVMSPHRGGAFGLPGIEQRRIEHLARALLNLTMAEADSD